MTLRAKDVRLERCDRTWDSLDGDDDRRHCHACARSVTDLSAMRERDARRFLATARGRVCVRYRHRADGRILFRDPASHGVGAVIGAALLAACSREPDAPVRVEVPLAVIGDAPPPLDPLREPPPPEPKRRPPRPVPVAERAKPPDPTTPEPSAVQADEIDCTLFRGLSQLGYYGGPEPDCD